MKRSSDRILTTHTGALHRPRDLEALLRPKFTGQPHDAAVVAKRMRSAVKEVVVQQAKAGVDVVNDGEYSKSSWSSYVYSRLDGVAARNEPLAWNAGKDRATFGDFYSVIGPNQGFYIEDWEIIATSAFLTPVVTGPLKYQGHTVVGEDIANLKAALKGANVEEAFLAVVAPGSVQPLLVNEHYSDDESLWTALAAVLHEEYLAITKAGLIVSIDDAFMPYLYDMRKDMTLKQFRRWANYAVEALNLALKGIPESQVRYHICWGSWNGPHSADVPLKDIVDLVLKVKAQAYSIEAANPRHAYEWQVWQDVQLPAGKILIPGVVEHATNVLEHPETVADRIVRYAQIVGRDNVIAGTDCGYRARIHSQLAWAKQQAITEGAELATKRLWRKRAKPRRKAPRRVRQR